ncbi:MAG: hypothetical protein D6701_04025 [Gemmatimonadetes bacterium]|nr:MAG: hypothetical protein D6701_04025 [Gemmatimonadota bacterium]
MDAYDLFLRDPEVQRRVRPDLVLRVGRSPTSAALQGALERWTDVRQIVIDPGGLWKDHGAVAGDVVVTDVAAFLDALTDRVPNTLAPAPWRGAWERLDEAARAQLEACPREGAFEGDLVADVVTVAPAGARLFVSNSMPVRDLDAFVPARPKPLEVHGNRGASGIDGIVSTAAGLSAGHGGAGEPPGAEVQPGAPRTAGQGLTLAIVGDLAFFHDANGLQAAARYGLNVVFVVLHNDGGGIFHMLPVREQEPAFTEYFATPHGLNFRHLAALHGLAYRLVPEARGFRHALREVVDVGGPAIVEIRTDRDENQRMRLAAADAVRSAALDVLDQGVFE